MGSREIQILPAVRSRPVFEPWRSVQAVLYRHDWVLMDGDSAAGWTPQEMAGPSFPSFGRPAPTWGGARGEA